MMLVKFVVDYEAGYSYYFSQSGTEIIISFYENEVIDGKIINRRLVELSSPVTPDEPDMSMVDARALALERLKAAYPSATWTEKFIVTRNGDRIAPDVKPGDVVYQDTEDVYRKMPLPEAMLSVSLTPFRTIQIGDHSYQTPVRRKIKIQYVIPVEQLSEDVAQTDYPVLWSTVQSYFPDMPDTEVAKVISLVTGVCPNCHAAARGCQCWNDE